jgi:hypothetical protein
MKLSVIIFSLFIISSCGLFSSNENGAYTKSVSFQNNIEKNIPKNWEKLKSEGSDFALYNTKTKSTFVLNTACRKSENSSLNALTSSILTGIDDLVIIYKKSLTLHEREAQELRVEGKVDGVKTYFNIITLQKNYCIYDLVLISSNLKKLDLDYKNYKKFVDGIIPE